VSWGRDSEGQVTNTPTGSGFTQVAGGVFHSLALRADGSIASWGDNSWSQVSDTPTGLGFVYVAAGARDSAALHADGTIVVWGQGSHGVISSAPVEPGYVQVSMGVSYAAALYAPDCNENGILDSIDIASGGSLDCDNDGIPDDCQEDCDLDGVLDFCQIMSNPSADCNLDGILDSCEIAANGLLDCDLSGVLDSCELASNPSLDCDANGTLDTCDIAFDPGLDYDQNGILDACECMATNFCLSVGNSSGTQAIIGGPGGFSIVANNFALNVVGAPPFKPGIFFYAGTQTQLFVGEGVLCVGPTVKRLQPVVLTDAQGTVVLPLDFTQPPLDMGAFGVTPLSTWNFQFWYRDPLGGPAGFNFSDGLEVTFCP
jgi:hypothetical protein